MVTPHFGIFGICPVCKEGWRVNMTGKMRKHPVTVPVSSPRYGTPCAGSGKPPRTLI